MPPRLKTGPRPCFRETRRRAESYLVALGSLSSSLLHHEALLEFSTKLLVARSLSQGVSSGHDKMGTEVVTGNLSFVGPCRTLVDFSRPSDSCASGLPPENSAMFFTLHQKGGSSWFLRNYGKRQEAGTRWERPPGNPVLVCGSLHPFLCLHNVRH